MYGCQFRILHVCHAVMYKQLSAWLLHGLLLDCYNEFFIMVKTTTHTGQISSPDEKTVETEDVKAEEKQLKVCVACANNCVLLPTLFNVVSICQLCHQ